MARAKYRDPADGIWKYVPLGNSANAMGVVVHGTNANAPRITGFAQVTWIGSVQPVNAVANDIWYNGGA